MQENRRARPTLRLLRSDLVEGWERGYSHRLIKDGEVLDLHPLSELPHPIIQKASESIGSEPALDNHEGRIRSSRTVPLFEIKIGQWRGAVWEDPHAKANWLIAAGLAKGGHQDHDDFYFRVEQAASSGTLKNWLPTDEDFRLLKQETAAYLITAWELEIQRQALGALRDTLRGGTGSFEVAHPVNGAKTMAVVYLEIVEVQEDDYRFDDALVSIDFRPGRSGRDGSSTSNSDGLGPGLQRGTGLEWQLTMRVLISLHSPEQAWDRVADEFSTYVEPGYWQEREQTLIELVGRDELAESEPGSQAHYAHRRHLTERTIEGASIRAMCGTFFVPRQDYKDLPLCPQCETRMNGLPQG